MDRLIKNFNTKLYFLAELQRSLPDKEPYIKAAGITLRALILTQRIERLRYVICKFLQLRDI